MHQILLIFRKDLRRFYPEILFVLLATAAFASFYPYTWLPHEEIPINLLGVPFARDALGSLPVLFIAVLPISWFVLIGRVVQDESLVGDRQYWVTRPISWQNLLIEKSLFLLLFVLLPFFAALLYLLGRGGFSVAANASRTLLLLLLDAAAFILPIFALATLTRTFFRLFLTVMAISAAIVIFAVALTSDRFSSPDLFLPTTDFFSLPLFVLICATVIGVQYASRTVWLSRAFAAVSLPILLLAASPLQSRMLESTFYPVAAPHQIPADLAISTDPSRVLTLSTYDKRTSIDIPIDVASIPYGLQITPENARLTVVSASGAVSSSSWQAIYNRAYTLNTRYGVIALRLDPPTLALLRAGPVTLQLQLALALNEYGPATRIPVPATPELAIPGLGLCARDPALSLHPGLLCRIPLRQPPLFLLAGLWTTQPCTASSAPGDDTAVLTASPGSPSPSPVDLSLTSVITSSESFSLPASTDTNLTELPPLRLCPGTTLTVIPLQLRRRARVQLTLPNYRLPERYR